jgi:hypothetical protein
MYPLHSDGLSTEFPSRSFMLLSFAPSEYTQSFSTTLSFAPSREFLVEIVFELSLLGQQRLQNIRGRALVPRIISFRPAAPSRYSRQGFGPSNCFFRASSAFETFEAGLRSLESSFRASSAFKLFEARLRSLELLLSGQQRLRAIRGWASILRVIFFGLVIPSENSGLSCRPLNHLLRTFLLSYQRSSINMPESWWQYASSDAVCQIRR